MKKLAAIFTAAVMAATIAACASGQTADVETTDRPLIAQSF